MSADVIAAVLHSHTIFVMMQDLKLELEGSDSSYTARKVRCILVDEDFLHTNIHDACLN